MATVVLDAQSTEPRSPALQKGGNRSRTIARKALNYAAQFWFVVAVAGQWIFALYVLGLYGGHAIRGNFSGWNNVLPEGFVPGCHE